MKLRFILLMMVVASFSAGAKAQEPRVAETTDSRPQSVTNGDRGRAFIIDGESQPVSVIESKGGVITAPEQVTIFLGSGWQTASARARESVLGNLLGSVVEASQIRAADQSGIKNFYAATSSQEKLDDFTDRSVSDLDIEGMLSTMIGAGSLSRPNSNTIYVVYLEPGLRSTLGSMIGGKHYLAYHNFFNASGMRVHYVVVPYVANQKTAYQVALRSFLAAAVNANGDSW